MTKPAGQGDHDASACGHDHTHDHDGRAHSNSDEAPAAPDQLYQPRTGVLGLLDRAGLFTIRTIVLVYRFTLSPFIGGQCRFLPTCSQYMLDAVAIHGPWRGGWRGLKRIARCNPFCKGGFDPA